MAKPNENLSDDSVLELLTAKLRAWCDAQNLPWDSADDLLAAASALNLTAVQCEWLAMYSELWMAAQAMDQRFGGL